MASDSSHRPGAPRFSSHAQITTILATEILSGARKPGNRMPSMEEMYETFGVSRVVVREVIRTLAAKGMVTSKSRVGTVVLAPSNWNWLDPEVLGWRVKLGMDYTFLAQITDVRLAVEPAAAALAARYRTRDDLQRMRAALKVMQKAEGNRRDFAEADIALHSAICTATGNPMVQAFIGVIEAALSGLLSVTSLNVFANHKTHAQATARHAAIIDAIEARNSDAAAKAMVRVIDIGIKYAASLQQKKPKKKS